MKNLNLITLILLLGALHVKAQQFTLSGQIMDEADGPLYISYKGIDGKTVRDSAIVQNQRFTFKGVINGATIARLNVSPKSSKAQAGKWFNEVELFLEPTTIYATGKFSILREFKFTGSKSQKDYEKYWAMRKPTKDEMDAIEDKWLANNDELIRITRIDKYDKRVNIISNTLDSLNGILAKNIKTIDKQFIASNPNSYVSAYILYSDKTKWDINDVSNTYKTFSPAIQNCYYGTEVRKLIKNIKDNSDGKQAKNFASVDIKGKTVKLTDFRGKYILLDFWGSWCSPCRESMPHTKQLFAKYHKSGFDIIAIAVDDKPADWKEAIEHDGTNIWHNIMNVKTTGQKKSIADNYSVHVFPTKILVGKDGTIIGRYDGSETPALDKKLTEVFGNRD